MSNPILLYSPIHDYIVENYTNKLLSLQDDEQSETWINSPGGAVNAGFSLIAALRMRKGKNKAIVMGDASSIAFYALMFFDEIEAIDAANFTIHRAASFAEIAEDVEFTEQNKKYLVKVNKDIRAKLEKKVDKDVFQKTTGVSFDEIFSMEQRKDVHLTAKQAKKIGIIDKIIKLEPSQIAAMANISFNSNKKSMKNPFAKEKPQKSVLVGENQLLYRELATDKGVEILGSTEPFTGNFEVDEKIVHVVENKITAISEIDKKDSEIAALKTEITALKTANVEQEAAFTEIMADAKSEMDELRGLITANSEILGKAKLKSSNPKLPVGEIKENAPVLAVDEKSKQYRIKKEIEARAAERQKEKETNQGGF